MRSRCVGGALNSHTRTFIDIADEVFVGDVTNKVALGGLTDGIQIVISW